MDVSYDDSELRRLAFDLGSMPPAVEGRLRTAVKASGLRLVSGGKTRAPVDTGFLRSSIGMDVDRDGLGVLAGPTAHYGAFVEDGTSRMAPQPYMSPAFDEVAPAFVDAVAQATDGLL